MRPSKEKLEKKIWYRISKVIFVIIFIGIILFGFFGFNEFRPQERTKYYDSRGFYNLHTAIEGSWVKAIFWLLIIVIIGFCFLFIVREIILYIIYGKGDKSIIEQIKKFLETNK